jgi:hypothetical protein
MERRYELRWEQMLAQADVSLEAMRGLLGRLEAFIEPYAKSLGEPEQTSGRGSITTDRVN